MFPVRTIILYIFDVSYLPECLCVAAKKCFACRSVVAWIKIMSNVQDNF